MEAVMSKPDDIDDVTGLSVAEMEAAAEDLYEHRDEASGDLVAAEHAPEIRSVVSVRYSRGEIEGIAAAATAAGLPLSTYIRNAALATSAAIDVETARRELQTATKALDELRRRLGTAA
jgi:predicted DNA binding CopG/RHH family protein